MPRGRHQAPSKAHAVAALVAAIVGSAAKVKPQHARRLGLWDVQRSGAEPLDQ